MWNVFEALITYMTTAYKQLFPCQSLYFLSELIRPQNWETETTKSCLEDFPVEENLPTLPWIIKLTSNRKLSHINGNIIN